MKKGVLALLFAVLAYGTYGQEKNIDTLFEKIDRTYGQTPDSAKVYLHQLLRYSPQLSDSLIARTNSKLGTTFGQLMIVDSTRFYYQRAVEKAQDIPRVLGDIYKQWAQSERIMSNFDKAFEVVDLSEKYYRESNYMPGVGLAYIERASSYSYMSKHKEAMEWLKKAIVLFDEIDEEKNKVFAEQELANSYVNTGEFEFARDLYEAILPDVKSNTAVINYYFTLTNYAYCLSRLGVYDKAEASYGEALKFFKDNNNETFHYYVLSKLGEIYLYGKKDYRKAVTYFSSAYRGMLRIRSVYLKSTTVDYLSALRQIGDMETAMEVVNQIERLDRANSLQYSDEIQVSYLERIKEIYSGTGNYKKALETLEKANQLRDSIDRKKDKIELNRIQEQYQNEYQRKENDILKDHNQLLERQNQNRNIIIVLVVVLSLIVVIAVIYGYQKQKKKVA
ncbi:tetratricopeptide repeat protein [Sinomicrobium sp.]